jgi:hypothetical protein
MIAAIIIAARGSFFFAGDAAAWGLAQEDTAGSAGNWFCAGPFPAGWEFCGSAEVVTYSDNMCWRLKGRLVRQPAGRIRQVPANWRLRSAEYRTDYYLRTVFGQRLAPSVYPRSCLLLFELYHHYRTFIPAPIIKACRA